jgi:membrane protein YdbS with pleckstrin-like domain
MSDISEFQDPPSRRTIGVPRWCALFVVLALLVSAVVLTAMGVGSIQNDQIITTVACLLILAMIVIATIVLSIAYRLRTTRANDDWIYW